MTVPGTNLDPAYGLVTTTTVEDATSGSPSKTTRTDYANPENRLATAVVADPDGLALRTETGYEAPGSGYLRRTSRTLPAGNTWTYAYYGTDTTATADNPCTSEVESIDQGGALWKRTGPDPDGAGPDAARVEEMVYDQAGRTVASRIGTGDWTCVSYDQRGRPTTKTIPALGDEPARTVTYNYAVGGNPQVMTVTDPTGTDHHHPRSAGPDRRLLRRHRHDDHDQLRPGRTGHPNGRASRHPGHNRRRRRTSPRPAPRR